MTKDNKPKEKDERKKKNIQSAVRSRDRLKNEQEWMSVQMSENEDRMKKLAKEIDNLETELKEPKAPKTRTSSSSQKDRPDWFGKPF